MGREDNEEMRGEAMRRVKWMDEGMGGEESGGGKRGRVMKESAEQG